MREDRACDDAATGDVGGSFLPRRTFNHYCSWMCRVNDVGPHYERDYRGRQRSHDEHYDRGFNDAWRARSADIEIPMHIWRAAMVLVHPDKWQGTPAMQALAHEVTVWLNQHRPSERP